MTATYGAALQSYGASGGTYGDLSGASTVFIKGRGIAGVRRRTVSTSTASAQVVTTQGVS